MWCPIRQQAHKPQLVRVTDLGALATCGAHLEARRAEGPPRQPKRGRLWLADDSCIRLRPERPNHVWSYDFVEDRTHDGRKFRMLMRNVPDEFTHEFLAIRVGRKLGAAKFGNRVKLRKERNSLPERMQSRSETASPLTTLSESRARELAFFLAIGGFSALCYAALNVMFTGVVGLRPSLSILLTLTILMPPTYAAQRWLTFRSTRGHAAAFPRYVATQMVGNGFGLAMAELCRETIIRHPTLAFLAVAIVVAITNYGFLKYWTFRLQR